MLLDAKTIAEEADRKVDAANKNAASICADAKRKVINMQEQVAKIKEDAMKQIDEVETRCARDNETARIAKEKAENYQNQQWKLLKDEEAKISKSAEKKIADLKASLEATFDRKIREQEQSYATKKDRVKLYYRNRYAVMETFHVICFGFCIVWLVIQACGSSNLLDDFASICHWIGNYCTARAGNIEDMAGQLGSIALSISNGLLRSICYWILSILSGTIMAVLFYGVPIVAALYGGYKYSRSKYFDKVSRWLMVASGIAMIVISANEIGIRWNIFILWIITQGLIAVIRFLIVPFVGSFFEGWKDMDADKKKDIAIVVMIEVIIMVVLVCIVKANPFVLFILPFVSLYVSAKYSKIFD